MDPSPGPEHLPNLLLDEAEEPSNLGLNPRGSFKLHTKPDLCSSGLNTQKAVSSELTGKSIRDAGIASIADAALPAQSSYRQGEQFALPLRLALARRSVKNQIFTYMDQGDRKADIESRTGLSHRCIKWHRRMWRTEGSHLRPRSKKLSKISARGPQSPGTRSERSLRKRPVRDEKGDSSVAGESSSDKRRRKHRTVKQSKVRSMRTGTEVPGSGGGECAERETRRSRCFAGKENVPERDDAMAMSGELKILPIRDLGS